MMPRCSGPEFRRRQLDDPLIADVPVIVLSAIADQLRMDELQPFANVAKPFDPDQLVQVIKRACQRASRMLSGRAQASAMIGASHKGRARSSAG